METKNIVQKRIILALLSFFLFSGTTYAGIATYKQISLSESVKDHRMTIGDLNGDGKIDYVFNDGRRSIKAFDNDGHLLWSKFDPDDPGVIEQYHNFTISVYDIDQDGKAEVICYLEINGEHHLAIIAGENGEIQTSIQVPFPAPRDHEFWGLSNDFMQDHIAIANLRGLSVPQDILAIHASKLKVAAYSYENGSLHLRWYWVTDHTGYSSGHYAYPYDIDGDGRDEVLAGVDILDDDGTRLWKIPLPPFDPVHPNWGPDHVDAMTAADIDTDNAGIELIVLAATGMWLYTADGQLLWTHPTKVSDPVNGYFSGEGVQEVLVADLLPNTPGLEMIIYSEDMYTDNSVALLDCKGQVIRWGNQSVGPRRWITCAMDWDGDRSVPEIFSRKGIFNAQFTKLSESMNWSALKTIDTDEFPPVVADVQGDQREEILFFDENEIVIFKNSSALIGDVKPSPWQDLRYRMRYANLNHTSPMYFDWKFIDTPIVTDQIPPEPPTQLVNTNTTEKSISLQWTSAPTASDGDAAVSYHVYRDGVRIANVSGTTFTDSNLKDDTPYQYQIFSVDDAGNESLTSADGAFSTVEIFYPHDQLPPGTSTLSAAIQVNSDDPSDLEISMTTTEPVIERPTPLIFIESDSSMTQILMTGTTPGTQFTGHLIMSEYLAEGIGIFRLPEGSLVSQLGNRSNLITQGATLNIHHPQKIPVSSQDILPPNRPTNLNSPAQSSNSISLSWQASMIASDGDGAESYEIYRNGLLIAESRQTVYTDNGLISNTTYAYAIYATDDAQNISMNALEGSFRTQQNSASSAGSVALYSSIVVGEPMEKENHFYLPIELITSEPVIQLPSPLTLIESDQTTTKISLSGKLPGDNFTGSLVISDVLAGGEAVFSLPTGSLVTTSGKHGNDIISGKSVVIDKTPPPSPDKPSITP